MIIKNNKARNAKYNHAYFALPEIVSVLESFNTRTF